jgi:leucyl/phenylalanyl-tRNA--protein transferase
MKKLQCPLPWLDAGEEFPAVNRAWGSSDPAPGLLAVGAALDVATLVKAYGLGIFPWFSEGQPTLWWSPNPRMTLRTQQFKLHRSLRKSLRHFSNNPACEIRIDTAFARVINACANKPRDGQPGTWILPEMIAAYCALHSAGHAHSVETWADGELVGGLYAVNLGGMVFGESMFADVTDASKIALCALVAFCLAHSIDMIDCQQNTAHLASLGANEVSRDEFTAQVATSIMRPAPAWQFDPVYWYQLWPHRTPQTP